MHLAGQSFGGVVPDPFLRGEVHRGWPTREVVDHGKATATAGFAGQRLLTSQVEILLVPLPRSGLVAKRLLSFFQRIRQLSLGRATGLLLFGEHHEDPFRGPYVFDTTGRYTGTIDGDRVVYRSVDSARIGSPTVATPRIDSIAINAGPAAILGDEPP